jgi:hypothetical protein
MTKSINVSLGGIAVLAVLFMFASFASAASVTNVEYSNGDVTVQGKAGESVSGKVRIVVPANEEVEFVQFDVISDNLAPVCVEVGRLQEGTHFVNIAGDVKFPPNTGTYDLQVKTSGIFGGLAAIDCNNNVTATQNFNNSVRTVGSSSSTSVGGGSLIEQLQKQIADLLKMIADLQKPTVPLKPAGCTAVVAYNGFNASAAQASLFGVDAGRAVFNSAGVYAPTGYFGPVSSNAAAAVSVACK